MKNKKVAVYSLVAALLVAGSNLHGMDGWKRRAKKGWEYTKDNKGTVGFYTAIFFSTVYTLYCNYRSNKKVAELKQKMNTVEDLQKDIYRLLKRIETGSKKCAKQFEKQLNRLARRK